MIKNTITEKQKNFIEIICEELDVEFKGSTKEEASSFISKYIKELELKQSLNQILYEECGFID